MIKYINILFVCYMTLGMSLPVLADSDEQRILITIKHTGKQDAALLRSLNRNYVPPLHYGSEIHVKRIVKDIAREYALVEVGNAWTIKILNVYCALLSVPSNQNIESVITQLENDKRIESVQLSYEYSTQTTIQSKAVNTLKNEQGFFYNDPYFSLQYKNRQNAVKEIHNSLTGENVVIAIVDTGADTEHIDLVDQIQVTRNFIDDNTSEFDTDIHGTAIAGIIAAKPNNELGIVGLAPDANIWMLKACRQLDSRSSVAQCNSFTLANALSVGIDEKIDIFNISLSGPRDPLVERLIQAALKQDITVIAADPINGPNRYPALIPGVVSVYALHDQDKLGSDDLQIGAKQLAISVNGQDILTTVPDDGFDFLSGSSMSTAIISALSALIVQRDGKFSFSELRKLVHRLL